MSSIPAFTFGTGTTALPGTATSTPLFGAATNTTAPAFGAPPNTTAPAFGPTAPATVPAFGTTAPATAPAFGAPNTSAPAFGAPNTAVPAFGATAPATVPAFGATAPATVPMFGQATTTSSTPLFGTAAPALATAPGTTGFQLPTTGSLGAAAAPTTISSTAVGGITTPATGIGLGAGLAAIPNTTAATLAATGSTAAVPGTIGSAGQQINFRQLEELMKKMTIDIEEQEKEFIDVATKVNYYDRIILNSAEKISAMNSAMARAKAEHEKMESVLDYMKYHQNDFERYLDTLDVQIPVENPNDERVKLYSSFESVNTQLQQMSEDLKEVIRHINLANKFSDRTDPISQIIRILNEHTDTLQWLDDQTAVVKEAVEEVFKLHHVFRRDQETALRLMFKSN